MAGNVTKKYTVELNLDVKTADAQVKKLATNINNMWADMGSAGNKFAVLKDLADYLEQIDKKIANLKGKDLDLFNKIFGADGAKINAALKDAVDPILKTPGLIADAMNEVQTKLTAIQDNPKAKGTAASLREIGGAINQMYKLIGQAPPINIEEQLTGGGKVGEKLAMLTKHFDAFKIEWKDVLATISANSGSNIAEGITDSLDDAKALVKAKVKEFYDAVLDYADNVKLDEIKQSLLDAITFNSKDLKKINQAFDKMVSGDYLEPDEASKAINKVVTGLKPVDAAAGIAIDSVASGFQRITQEANTAGKAIQKVMYHLGNLLSGNGHVQDTFEEMAYNLTDAAADDSRYKKYGYGVLGGGLFGVSDPSTIDAQTLAGGKFLHSIDLSKYSMYIADTEERATNLIDFLSKFQKYAFKSAEPNYSGFDEQLDGINIDVLYDQFKIVFNEADLTKEKFNNFFNEMVGLLRQAGLTFDAESEELDFTSIGNLEGSENISTRLMKMLGYQGVNVGGTSFDGMGQGSVLFEFDQSDIIGYFNTLDQAVEDFQKRINNVSWDGTNEQLIQYRNEIDAIIARLEKYKSRYKDVEAVAQFDTTIERLTQVQANIDSVLSGNSMGNSGSFKQINDGIQHVSSDLEKATVKLKEFYELTDLIQSKDVLMSDTEIGKYTERLDVAEKELKALGDQGLITAEELDKINEVIAKSRIILDESELANQDPSIDYSSGKYDYTYAAELYEEEQKNKALQAENDNLRRQLAEENQNLVKQRENVAQEDISAQEAAKVEELLQKIKDIKHAVEEKTAAFREEADTVDGVVGQEVLALNRLKEAITDIELALDTAFAADRKLSLPEVKTGGVTTAENPHYVTDPQGKPVTMYRGIHGAYGGLVSNRYHGGTFSTDNLELAKEYAGELGKVEKVLLSMKKPLEIEGNGALWNQIEYIGTSSDKTSRRLHELQSELSAVNELIKEYEQIQPTDKENDLIRKGLITETEAQRKLRGLASEKAKLESEKKAIFADSSNPYGIKNTNQIVEIAKAEGFDGVIFKNIIDSATGAVNDMSNVMVTFEQNQIHYVETIGATLDNALNLLKQRLGPFADYINSTAKEISDAVATASALERKLSVGEITQDEYDKLSADNLVLKDLTALSQRLGTTPDFIKKELLSGDSFSLETLEGVINSFFVNMRERLQNIATTFGVDDISPNDLLTSSESYRASEQQTRQDKVSADSTPNLLQSIDQVLGQILAVLQGFTGIESDNKNAIKVKEPSPDVSVGTSDAYELLANKLPDGIATESTLGAIRGSVEQIASQLKIGDDTNVNVKDAEDLSNAAVATDVVADNLKDIVYHAGDLSNIANTLKTLPLGNFKPTEMDATFNGFTGLYTTEDFEHLSGNEWEGAPISTIDLSQYKMFDAKSDELATKVKDFFNSLNKAIYGYIEAWDYDAGDIVSLVNDKTVEELYREFQQVFQDVKMDFKTFQDFIDRSKAVVKGHTFNDIEIPDLDQAVSKFGTGTTLQGVSQEVFNADTFQTQLLKMLGFEGIDLRGTKYNSAYTGGTVLFDIKPESVKSVNEKWTDVARRNYPENDFWYDSDALSREEKRRQLAFETARAYSQQAQIEQQITAEKKQQEAIENTGSAEVADTQREAIEMEQLATQVRDVEAAVKSKTDAFTQEGAIVNQVVQQEIAALQSLINKLNAVKAAVEAKTSAFKSEGTAVNDVVSKEAAIVGEETIADNTSDIQKETQAHKDNADAIKEETVAQQNLNAEQQKQDSATNKKKASNDTGSKNNKDVNIIARLDSDVQNSADSLKRLVTSTESLGVAFRGVYNDGSRVVYDVLDNGVIKSYALELDRATGNVYKMELSERELVNTMQNVNKVAKQHKELGGILDLGDVNQNAAVIKNYLKAKNDLDTVVTDAWAKAQQNGGIIDQTDLDVIHAMSQEVMRLGSTIQYEYKRISNIKDTGGIFKALGGDMSDDVEARMRKYIDNVARLNTQSVTNIQYDSATKAMTADLVDLSGHITKVHLQYNELFDGVQTTSSKGTQAIDKTAKKMDQLKQSVSSALSAGLIDKNLAQYKKYEHGLSSLADHLRKIQDGDIAFDDAAIHKWEVLRKTIVDAGNELVKISDINRIAQQTTTGAFATDKKQAGNNFANYNESVKDAAYLTQDLKDELNALKDLLQSISTSADLSIWNDDFKALQTKISKVKEDYSLREKGKLNLLSGQLSSINFKKLGIDKNQLKFDDEDQSKIVELYRELEIEIEKCSSAVKRGEEISTASIEANIAALNKQIQTYKTKNNIVERSTPKTTDRVNAQSKFNSIESRSQAYIDAGSTVVSSQLKEYKATFEKLVALQNTFKAGQTLNADQELQFTELKNKCNDYYKSLKKVLDASDDLRTNGSKPMSIMDDVSLETFDDRAKALKNYVQETYGASAAIDKLNGDATKLTFTIKNGDGTITNMTAALNRAGTEIRSVAGDTEKATTKFSRFFDGVKGKAGELLTYATARFGIDEIFQVIRQGIEEVRAIDSALTELKKVTNGTSAEYDAFLETMASTGSRIGATVSDLTTMAAEWAKLGYTMRESAMLAESTAVLLNVSEFTDATAASEALISTMQAFGYGAEESMHVVDILNEVGNNYAITSDGIATALQDSASALMEGGNSLEEAVALVAAANRVVQDPSSVGSALRTISLRLRGTSVEILEEMGEETDGVIESTSKLQEKIKALSGVDILTDAGDYKDTYTILKEIGNVWEDMSDIDQAALLELMAGKNRANTLSAILSNMKDLEGAYESAMKADGSAMAENERYLDSIEGKITKFKAATQTMWIHFLDDKVIKWFVDLGTQLIKLLDKVGVLRTAFVGLMGVFALKSKGDFGILDWVEKLVTGFKSKGAGNISSAVDATASIFSALSEVQNKTLSMDGISNVATKIDDISNAAKNGQAALFDYASGLDQSDVALKAYIASVDDGNYSLAGFQQFIDQHNKQLAATSVKAKLAAAGHALLNSALTMGASLLLSWAVPKVIEWLDDMHVSAEEAAEAAAELAKEVEDLSDAYNTAKGEFSDNLDALTISSDTDTYATLQDEFEELTKGVNAYGENISLTSDEYARYKSICETIVGIQPSIAAGYDSATRAIGNNAGVLERLINLQKEEARLNAAEYVSYGVYANNDNFKNMADVAIGEYNKAAKKYQQIITDSNEEYFKDFSIDDNYMYNFFDAFSKAEIVHLFESGDDEIDPHRGSDNVAYEIMELMGYNNIKDTLEDYMVDGVFDSRSWLGDYAEAIIANKDIIVEALGDNDEIISAFNIWAGAQKDGAREIEAASDYMIDAFLQIPYALEEYEELSIGEKSFITEWIKNSDMFKIDPDTTLEDILAAKQVIIDTVRAIASNDYMTEITNSDGKVVKVSAQTILDQMFDINPSEVDYGKYQEQMQTLIGSLWDAIGGSENTLGFLSEQDLALSLGFDLVFNQNQERSLADDMRRITGMTGEEIQEWMDSQPAYVIRAMIDFDWSGVASTEDNPIDADDMAGMAVPDTVTVNVKAVASYSALSDEVASYNELLAQTNELTGNNVKVTQEYKDALKELGITDEELNECFDENNGLVVTNTEKLRKLVKEKEKEIAANVRLSKSQTQLEYYNLVKQLNDTLAGTRGLDAGTRDLTSSIMEQIDIVKLAIYQYQLLEDNLLGVTNGFKEYQQAQEVDALNTYGDDYVSMAQTMYDALYKTGEAGTAANWAAIEALVPDEVYKHLETDGERMKAIYEYFNNNILPTLTLNEDQLSLEYDNIEDFIQKGLKSGVFEGDLDNFNLVEGMNLEEAARLMGLTETQAYALFATLDKYNTSGTENSFLSQLDDSLAGRIMNITNHVEELNKEKLALLEGGVTSEEQQRINEINHELGESRQQMSLLGKEAYNTWQEYTTNDAALAALGEIENKQEKLTKEGATKLGLDWDEVSGMTVQQAYDYLLAKQLELEEPTVLTASLAIESIDQQLAELQAELNDPKTSEERKIEIQAEIQGLEEDKALLATTFGITLSEEDQKTLEEELKAIEDFTIGDKEFKVIVKGTSAVSQQLNNIKDVVNGLKDKTITVTVQEKSKSTNTGKSTNTSKKSTHVGGGGGHYAIYADGTAHADGTAFKGGSWGAPRTETALVGELGPEMVVRNGRWFTVGDNGAEFTDIKHGDIIFNHKQTQDLLSKGYVTGRGKAYAEGTAYAGLWRPTSPDTSKSNTSSSNKLSQTAKEISDAVDELEEASDEFYEVFDWSEIRLSEINEQLELMEGNLDNASGVSQKNSLIDQILALNGEKITALKQTVALYQAYANELLLKIPEKYRTIAQNGLIDLEIFSGKIGEKILDAIKEYREWADKIADLKSEMQSTSNSSSDYRQEKLDNLKENFDNIANSYDSQVGFIESANEKLEAQISLLEEKGEIASAAYYEAMAENTKEQISVLQAEKQALQNALHGLSTEDWYDAMQKIYDIDNAILACTIDLESYQNAINQITWDRFDELIRRIEYIHDEIEGLIGIMSYGDLFDDEGEWTKEGITTLGLYVQQMENAEYRAKEYAEAIDVLNKDYKKGKYSETEYLEKLNELKSAQTDCINTYYEAQEAIQDLNSERIDAVKDGMEKEIDAYSKLIEKQKEALNAEKDLYDFEKNVSEQQKGISTIERKLAALAGDTSASAAAKRKQLEAELLEAQGALEDTYYERSMTKQQEALDAELESFEKLQEAKIEELEKYVENLELVVSDSIELVQSNSKLVYDTLNGLASEYNLTLSQAVTAPWKEGEFAIADYQNVFGTATSATIDQLELIKIAWQEVIDKINEAAQATVNSQEAIASPPGSSSGGSGGGIGGSFGGGSGSGFLNISGNGSLRPSGWNQTKRPSFMSGNIQYGQTGSKVEVLQTTLNTLGYSCGRVDGIFGDKTLAAVQKFQRSSKYGGAIVADGIVGPDTKKKFRVAGYAQGTTGVKKDELAIIDEMGLEEIVMHVQGGKLAYLSKGSAVLPHDISENLMELGQLDPSAVLERSKPQIGLPREIHNTEIHIDNSVAELIHIDNCSTETLPDVKKIVNEALEKHTQKLNNSLKKFVR